MNPEMKSPANLAASFAAGFLAVWLADRLVQHWTERSARSEPTLQSDAKLRAQVRDRMDMLVSHPRAIEVEVHEGIVRVSGQVLAQELDGLLLQLLRVPGVLKVHNALASVDTPHAFGEASPL